MIASCTFGSGVMALSFDLVRCSRGVRSLEKSSTSSTGTSSGSGPGADMVSNGTGEVLQFNIKAGMKEPVSVVNVVQIRIPASNTVGPVPGLPKMAGTPMVHKGDIC
jgi:hypothetical protein